MQYITTLNLGKYIYQGELDYQHRPNGSGTLYMNDQTKFMVYTGNWTSGNRNGYGVQYDKNGQMLCAGTFYNNAFVNGTYHQNRGNIKIIYEGEFKDGFINKGKMFYNGILHYNGEYDSGIPDGTGTFYWDNGYIRYKGDVKQFKKHGIGEIYNNWGYLSYIGEFYNDNKHGNGTSFYDDGKTVEYKGEWMGNDYHGEGILYNSDGSIQKEGRFSFGVYMSTKKPYIPQNYNQVSQLIFNEPSPYQNKNNDLVIRDNYIMTYSNNIKCTCEFSKDTIFICCANKHDI